MTLQQQAFQKIEQLPDENIRVLIELMDVFFGEKKSALSLDVEKKANDRDALANKSSVNAENIEVVPPVSDEDAAEKWRKRFFATAGKIEVDEDAYRQLRERSMR